RTKRRQSETVVDAPHERRTIRRHRQRAAKLAVAENGMRLRVIRGVAQVELGELILKRMKLLRPERWMLCHIGHVLETELLEEIRFPAQKSRDRGVEVGGHGPDQPRQLRRASVIGRIRHQLDDGAWNPANESVRAR